MKQRLEPGDRLPTITADTVQGDRVRVPEDLSDNWGVVLVYRGHF